MGKPLVTVSIITYNSSKTVLETLNSIYYQSYPRIELVISDDCSKDDTIDICNRWILEHYSRFESYKIIESDKNTGVTANCNRAINDTKGEFLKIVAADDLLLPEALTEYVDYMLSNPGAVYVFSKVVVFGNKTEAVKQFTETIFDYSFFLLSPEDQYIWLIDNWFQPIPAVSTFINVTLASSLGVLYYDERIPMLEDWPKWIQISEKNIKFHFIEKELAKYRVSDNSICSGEQYRAAFRQSKALLYIYYQFKPTIRLFGLRRGIALYIKNKGILNNHSIWSILAEFTESVMKHYHKH